MSEALADNRPPRILIVTTRLDIGGTEQHLVRILGPLRRQGLDVSLFVLERGGKLERRVLDAGVSIAGPQRRWPRILHALRAGLQLRRYLRWQKPDILHFFLSEPYLVGSFAAFGVPGIHRIMSRRSLNDYQRKHPALARIERWLHARTSVLLGNSSAVVSDLREECGECGKIGLIHNGIDVPDAVNDGDRRVARDRLQLPHDVFVFAVNANLIPYKGHRDLFEALGLIKDKLSASWRLLLIGRDQGIGADLRLLSETLGFADKVVWLGERNDAQALLDAADVSVLPSHEEGFSNSLIEAMGRGLPVLATAVGGNLDAITHEETGLLAAARHPEALAGGLLRLYQDEALRRRLGAAARGRVMLQFSIDGCVARYANLYRGWPFYRTVAVQTLIDGKPPISA